MQSLFGITHWHAPQLSLSTSPSECVDDDSWEAVRNGGIAKCGPTFPEILCGHFSQSIYISNGKTAAEACCVCGGSKPDGTILDNGNIFLILSGGIIILLQCWRYVSASKQY